MNNSIKFNSVLNDFETAHSAIKLSSSPKNIGIGAHFFCNAKCIFCLGGDYPQFSIERYKMFFEEKLKDVLSKAENVDFHGYGELLLMPGINSFIKRINKTLPNQTKTFFTNGINLKNKDFDGGKFNVIVSLHASDKKMHKYLTCTDAFDGIVENIKNAKKQKNLKISLYSVLNKINLCDMENLVRLAAKLKIDSVIFRYLTIFEYKDFDLTVFADKKKTNDMIDRAAELAKKYGVHANMPRKFFSQDLIPKICRCPWNYIYAENQGTVNACVFAGKHIGSLEKNSFLELWNSDRYKKLRKELADHKPNEICSKCPEYISANIDKISSHITFRPDTHKKMMEYAKKNMKKFNLTAKDI